MAHIYMYRCHFKCVSEMQKMTYCLYFYEIRRYTIVTFLHLFSSLHRTFRFQEMCTLFMKTIQLFRLSLYTTNNGNMLHIYHKVISLEQSWRQLTYFTVKINLNFIWSRKHIWEVIRISKKKPSGAETKTIKRNTETFELCFVIRNKFVTTDLCCFSWVLWSRLF